MAKVKKRSVLPIYAIAVVWVLFTLFHSLYRVSDFVTVILLSAVAFIVAKGIWPTKEYFLPDPEPKQAEKTEEEKAQEKAQQAKAEEEAAQAEKRAQEKVKASSQDDAKINALIQEKNRAISEMRRLNDAIEDQGISDQIDQMERITAKIIDHVVQNPEKLPQIKKFMNYYLPTTLKILNAYDRMGAAGVSGENIDGTMRKIETMLDTVVKAFEKQLDALFQDEAFDISSDITVMENMLAREGLSGEQFQA